MKNKYKILIAIIIIIICIIITYFINSKREDIEYERREENKYSEIEYSVPSELTKSEYDNHYYSYDNFDSRISCYLSIYPFEKKYHGSFEEWFKKSISITLNSEVSEVKKLTIDGKDALYVEVLDDGNNKHYYGVSSSNYYYQIEYRINDYLMGDRVDDDNVCFTSEDKIISSIKIK